MPLLTKEQVVAAVFELTPEERREVAELLAESLHLAEEESVECRERIESYHGHLPDLTAKNEAEFEHQVESLA